MKTLYFVIFILIIPMVIFLFIIFNDVQFRKLLRSSKHKQKLNENISNNKDSKTQGNVNTVSQKILSLDDGIGFGFGKEFFTGSNSSNGTKQPIIGCKNKLQKFKQNNCPKKKIGIVFHKFKMNHSYKIKELDDVILSDYCSRKFLDHNFVNVMNNIWFETGYSFFTKDIVIEDELQNLSNYYLHNVSTTFTDYPECCGYVRTPSGSDKPTSVYDKRQKYTTTYKDNTIKNEDKTRYSWNDLELLKKLLAIDYSNSNIITEDSDRTNIKKVIRSILVRMTDETIYQDKYKEAFHIYLLPYIEMDNVLIVNGKGEGYNRPLIFVSMNYKKQSCNELKRTIEDLSNGKTCDLWMVSLLDNYKSIIDIKSKIDTITGRVGGKEKLEEIKIKMDKAHDKINDLEECNYVKIDDLEREIRDDTVKLREIYEFDFNSDKELRSLKKYKGYRTTNPDKKLRYKYGFKTDYIDDSRCVYPRKEQLIPVEDNEPEMLSYQDRVDIRVKQIKNEQKLKIAELNKNINDNKETIKTLKERLNPHNQTLASLKSDWKDRTQISDSNYEQLKFLQKSLNQKKSSVNEVQRYIKKAVNVVNINSAILSIFLEINLNLNSIQNDPSKYKFKNNNKDLDTGQLHIHDLSGKDEDNDNDYSKEHSILKESINNGGISFSDTSNSNFDKHILESRITDFLKFKLEENWPKRKSSSTELEQIILINRLNTYKDMGDKCHQSINSLYSPKECKKSRHFETMKIYSKDRDARYYEAKNAIKNSDFKDLPLREKKKLYNTLNGLLDQCRKDSKCKQLITKNDFYEKIDVDFTRDQIFKKDNIDNNYRVLKSHLTNYYDNKATDVINDTKILDTLLIKDNLISNIDTPLRTKKDHKCIYGESSNNNPTKLHQYMRSFKTGNSNSADCSKGHYMDTFEQSYL